MTYPNGDRPLARREKTLYVANSDPEKALWMAFPVKAGRHDRGRPGLLRRHPGRQDAQGAARRPERSTRAGKPVRPPAPAGVLVFAPDGTPPRDAQHGEATANVGFGDDGSTLYITADMYLARVKTTTKGRGFLTGRRTED